MDNPWNFETGSWNDIDLAVRPHSWWRSLLGFVPVRVISSGRGVVRNPQDENSIVDWTVTKDYYVWRWRPALKYRSRRK